MKEFCISKANLSIVAGMEGQITFDEYLASITEDTQLENDLKQVFSVMSLFSGAGMLDWAFIKTRPLRSGLPVIMTSVPVNHTDTI